MPPVFSAGQTLYKKFTTRDANVPATLTAGTVSVYKDDSTTESTTGVTLSADFDGKTGLNHVTIDTSADGTFYSNGGHFELVLTAGTVGGTTVISEVVGDFDLAAASGPTSGGVNVTQINGQTASASGTVTFPSATLASTTNITAGTITTTTNLTNLPAAPTDWLTAAAVKADAVTKIQAGLPTAASIATAVWTDTTAGDFTTPTSPGKIIFGQLGGAFTTASSSVFSTAALANGPTGGSAPSATTVAAAVWNEVLTSATHNIANSAGKLLRLINPSSDVIYSGTLPSQVGMTSTQIKLDTGASSSDNVYNNGVLSIPTGTGAGQSAIILGYVGSTRVATLDRAWVVQPTATATFEITPLTTVAVVGSVTVGAMNTGVITANSIASGALNGKGDWLASLGATAPAGWIDASAVASGALNGKGDWSTLTAAGVWVNSVRTLTAGTNIVLTKGIGITGFTDLDAAGIRAAVGMDIADLDAQLDLLPTAAEAADKLLGRNIAGGSDGGRTVAEAMAFLRNKWSISGGTLIVCATNDSTTLWTAAVTTTSGNPVTAIDPS